MKNYLKILETSKKDTVHKNVALRKGEKDLSQWNAIKLTEEAADTLLERLQRVLPPELELKISNVKLNLFEKAEGESTLMVKAQLYETEDKHILLKVFVHEQTLKGKTRKIARAIYELGFTSVDIKTRVM